MIADRSVRSRPATPALAVARLLAASVALLLGACAPAPQAPVPPARAASAETRRDAARAPSRETAAPSRESRVERVVDGDTFVLADGERVRLLGIDTPERRDTAPVLAQLAERARQELARRVEGGVVRLSTFEPERDRFGRLLAHADVVTAEGVVDVGEALLAAGLARTFPGEHPRRERYATIEAAARARGEGVWTPEARKAWGPRAEVFIGPADVAAHLGKIARVEGRLGSARRAKKVLLLTIEGGGARLKVVSFRPESFPDALLAEWQGREVAVTGKLQMYQGAPELILEGPDQIERPASEPAGASGAGSRPL